MSYEPVTDDPCYIIGLFLFRPCLGSGGGGGGASKAP